MAATITGKLVSLIGAHDGPEEGSVEFALCGYGSQTPRAPDVTFARVTSDPINAKPADGTWTAAVAGNDIIEPAGTYYTVTTRNNNGDITQVNAYVFTDGSTYDLNYTVPFDPNQPPPPLPTLLTNQLLIVPFSTNPEFPGDEFTTWQLTLTGDIWPTFINLVDGNLYTIILIQDANGEHTVSWPANVYNTTLVNPEPNSFTIQTFVAVSDQLYPIGAATYYP